MGRTIKRLFAMSVAVATVGAICAPAMADPPSADASCLGQYAVFVAQTTDPNLGQGLVAPGATSAPGAVSAVVTPLATEQPHTYHC
jgi:hypothetical protein